MRELTLDERVYFHQKRFFSYVAKCEVEPEVKTVEDVRRVYGVSVRPERMTDECIKQWMDQDGIPTHLN